MFPKRRSSSHAERSNAEIEDFAVHPAFRFRGFEAVFALLFIVEASPSFLDGSGRPRFLPEIFGLSCFVCATLEEVGFESIEVEGDEVFLVRMITNAAFSISVAAAFIFSRTEETASRISVYSDSLYFNLILLCHFFFPSPCSNSSRKP